MLALTFTHHYLRCFQLVFKVCNYVSYVRYIVFRPNHIVMNGSSKHLCLKNSQKQWILHIKRPVIYSINAIYPCKLKLWRDCGFAIICKHIYPSQIWVCVRSKYGTFEIRRCDRSCENIFHIHDVTNPRTAFFTASCFVVYEKLFKLSCLFQMIKPSDK